MSFMLYSKILSQIYYHTQRFTISLFSSFYSLFFSFKKFILKKKKIFKSNQLLLEIRNLIWLIIHIRVHLPQWSVSLYWKESFHIKYEQSPWQFFVSDFNLLIFAVFLWMPRKLLWLISIMLFIFIFSFLLYFFRYHLVPLYPFPQQSPHCCPCSWVLFPFCSIRPPLILPLP